jgi:hypothetical protein
MRGDRPKVTPETLFPRRLAARALDIVLQHFNLSAVVVKLNPDDPEQAFPGAEPGEVRLYLDGWGQGKRPVAIVFLEGTRARVVVERVRELVRRNHRADFVEEDVGIVQFPGEPDIDMEVDVAGVVDDFGQVMRTAPQRVDPRPVRRVMWPKGRERR